MITAERYAIASRTAIPGQARPGRRRRPVPALPDRSQVLESLGSSVLVQLMLAMSLVAVAGLLYLAQASQASVLQYNITELQIERAQLTAQNGSLHATAMNLQSPQRIVTAAQTRLHMRQPDPSNTLWVAPTFPAVTIPPPAAVSRRAAQQRSRPLAWMRRVLQFVRASL